MEVNSSSVGTNSFGGLANKRNTLKSQRTGSFGGSVPITEEGQPLNVSKKHINQMPRLNPNELTKSNKGGSSYGLRASTQNKDMLEQMSHDYVGS